MVQFRTVRRIAGSVALALLLLLSALLAAVQAQQWLLRWRVERLMADMHRIRLYQTTWPEAQRLMSKWGAWGHCDGACTAEDCEYAITMANSFWGGVGVELPGWLRFILKVPRVFSGLGGRLGILRATITVHNGTGWRTKDWVELDVPPEWFSSNPQDGEYSLILTVRSRQQLHPGFEQDRILGDIEQLAEHPYFVAGSPSGCEICLAGEVTYSTRTPQWQIDELTKFNFSCFTQWHPCRFLRDLYPATDYWHIVGGMFDFGQPRKMTPPTAADCDIPVWALGRDFNSISEVEALTSESVKDGRYAEPQMMEKVKIKVLSTIKGSRRMDGLTADAYPYAGNTDEVQYEVAEHMQMGQRYLLLRQDKESDPPLPPGLTLERCGVQLDTPDVREELKKGISMNDDYVDRRRY